MSKSRIRISVIPRGVAALVLFASVTAAARSAEAQITIAPPASSGVYKTVPLEDQLINRLRATTGEQQAFIRFIATKVREGRLEPRLVLAVERYAIKRNRQLPFNFFERAIRFEASRRGVGLPAVQTFVTTKSYETMRRNR